MSNEERETPSVSGNLLNARVSPRSNVSAESFPTRLSTRVRKPSEHLARKCCACSTSHLSPKSDEKKPRKISGSANKAVVKKASPPPCKDDSETKRRRARMYELSSISKERASIKAQQDDFRSKSASDGKASVTAALKKLKGGVQERVEPSRTTLIRKQPASTSPNKTEVKSASPWKFGKTKVEPKTVNSHKTPTSKPCSSKQPFKNTHSPATSKLKERAVPKLKIGNEPKRQASQAQRVLIVKTNAEPKTSKSQSKLSSECESDSDSDSIGSDGSSESSDIEHHISSEELDKTTGWNCGFCEEDLAVSSWGETEREAEFSQLPVVSVLSCGHAFHSHCLDSAGFGAQEDPSCVLCESVDS